VGGQTAEQIIAGVVLSERLAVTMYGAIHRAQWSGQRNMRALVVDPKLLAEDAFRTALTDPASTASATRLDRATIVPTMAVESNGPDVVIITRGVGRYVTVQDLIAAARANRGAGGKLPLPVAAAISKSLVEALAVAHAAGVVHGAVHPRSVLIDEDGGVRLGDFIVGRALTTAVAQGADSSLWRGLAGYLAPELVVGEDPSPACDVFAAGAMLFTMLSGEVPPGTLGDAAARRRRHHSGMETGVGACGTPASARRGLATARRRLQILRRTGGGAERGGCDHRSDRVRGRLRPCRSARHAYLFSGGGRD
jgi:hypothetical protein